MDPILEAYVENISAPIIPRPIRDIRGLLPKILIRRRKFPHFIPKADDLELQVGVALLDGDVSFLCDLEARGLFFPTFVTEAGETHLAVMESMDIFVPDTLRKYYAERIRQSKVLGGE